MKIIFSFSHFINPVIHYFKSLDYFLCNSELPTAHVAIACLPTYLIYPVNPNYLATLVNLG